MVVLSFTVTDSKGHYVNGLKPKDFRIMKTAILQKIATFAEGNKPPVQVMEDGIDAAAARSRNEGSATGAWTAPTRSSARTCSCCSIPATYMYRGFVYASDAIADFVRGLDRADSVAVYTFSRNLSRAASLDARSRRGDSRACARPWPATIRALQRPAADPCAMPPRCPAAKW